MHPEGNPSQILASKTSGDRDFASGLKPTLDANTTYCFTAEVENQGNWTGSEGLYVQFQLAGGAPTGASPLRIKPIKLDPQKPGQSAKYTFLYKPALNGGYAVRVSLTPSPSEE